MRKPTIFEAGGITMDTQALFKLSYGLFVLTAAADGRESGCIDRKSVV